MQPLELESKSWQQSFSPNEKAYYKAITRFIDRPFFGHSKKSGDPYHANGERDPYQDEFFNKNTLKTQRRQRLFKHEDVADHFHSDPTHWNLPTRNWSYLVNSPKSDVHLHCLEIDFHVEGEGQSDAQELAAWIASVDDFFGGVTVFVEPSRKRRGAYLWFLMRRHRSPAEYNDLLNRVSALLRNRYNGGSWAAKIDAIKGTLQFHSPNPDFDFPLYAEHGDAYIKQKRSYFFKFEPNKKLEGDLHHRGTLITMPCAGVHNFRQDRLETFLQWVNDDSHIIDDSLFANMIEAEDALVAENEAVEAQDVPEKSGKKKTAGNRAWERLKSGNGWNSSMGACFYASQSLGRVATPEEVCDLYEAHGAATGPRTEERVSRMGRILKRLVAPTFDPTISKSDPNWFTDADLARGEELMRSKLSKANLERVCKAFRCSVDYRMAGMALCIWRKNIITNRGEVPYSAIRNLFKHFKQGLNNWQIRAMLEVLIEAGILICRNLRDYDWGRCRKYELVTASSPLPSGEEEEDNSIGTTASSVPPSPAPEMTPMAPPKDEILAKLDAVIEMLRKSAGL